MKIGLFGCGAYGMAISSILIENKCEVTMWTKFEEEKEQLDKTRRNEKLIPNFKLDTSIIDLMEWFIVDLPKPGKSINVILYLFLISLIIGLKISLFDPHPCRKIIS